MALSLDGSANVLSTSGTSATTGTLACSNAGNVICVAITVNPGGTNAITSITGGGVTFTQRIADINGAAAGAGDNRIELWTGYASGTFNAAVVVNFAGSTSFVTVHAWGVSGAPSSSYFDANASLPAHMTPSLPTVVMSTTTADTMLITCFRESSSANPTATSGWTLIYGAGFTLSQYKIVSAAQTLLTVTDPSGSPNGGFGDAIVQSSGGSAIKTVNGLALANVKTVNGLEIASVKTVNGLA